MEITDSLFLLDSAVAGGDRVRIEGDEARHILQSRRLTQGGIIFLTDGQGFCARAEIIESGPKNRFLDVSITETGNQKKSVPDIILASALVKGDRQSVLLNMATQMGMDGFIPLDCDFSAVKYQPKMKQRWQRLIITACKQCRQCHFPIIMGPQSLEDLFNDPKEGDVFVVGDSNGNSLDQLKSSFGPDVSRIIMVVGPEGGFSDRENKIFQNQNSLKSPLLKLRLSNRILRTETAAISLVGAVNQGIWMNQNDESNNEAQ
jgi:16S rRNA (uracil1498-N3)-methyltransferase